MSLKAGDPAPLFTLYNTEKQEVSLEQFLGKNVLIHFFPLAFTSVCTAQLCNARDNMEVYTKLDCVVLGISIDTLFSLGEFRNQQGFSFDLLSDFNKTTIKDYDLVIDQFAFDMHGVSKRAAFVIDAQGIIRYAEVCPTPGDQPDYGSIVKVLEELK